MLIRAIDYKGNRIFKAYKNGIIVWSGVLEKYFSIGTTSIFIIQNAIARCSPTVNGTNINTVSELIYQAPVNASQAENSNINLEVVAVSDQPLHSSRAQHKNIDTLIGIKDRISFYNSPARHSRLDEQVSILTNPNLPVSPSKRLQIDELVKHIIITPFNVSPSVRGKYINGILGLPEIPLNISPSVRIYIDELIRIVELTKLAVSPSKKMNISEIIKDIRLIDFNLSPSAVAYIKTAICGIELTDLSVSSAKRAIVNSYIQNISRAQQESDASSMQQDRAQIEDIISACFVYDLTRSSIVKQYIAIKGQNQIQIQQSRGAYLKQATNALFKNQLSISKTKGVFILSPILANQLTDINSQITKNLGLHSAILLNNLVGLRNTDSQPIEAFNKLGIIDVVALNALKIKAMYNLLPIIILGQNKISAPRAIWQNSFNKIETISGDSTFNSSEVSETDVLNVLQIWSPGWINSSASQPVRSFDQLSIDLSNIYHSNSPTRRLLLESLSGVRDSVNVVNVFLREINVINEILISAFARLNIPPLMEKAIFYKKICINGLSLFNNDPLAYAFGNISMGPRHVSIFASDLEAEIRLNSMAQVTSIMSLGQGLLHDFTLLGAISGYSLSRLGMSEGLIDLFGINIVKSSVRNILTLYWPVARLAEAKIWNYTNTVLNLFKVPTYAANHKAFLIPSALLVVGQKAATMARSDALLVSAVDFTEGYINPFYKADDCVSTYLSTVLVPKKLYKVEEDFVLNINTFSLSQIVLGILNQKAASLNIGFHETIKMDFANENEKWQYPVWNSEVEEERNNIFITQVFNFSLGTGKIK